MMSIGDYVRSKTRRCVQALPKNCPNDVYVLKKKKKLNGKLAGAASEC